MRLSFLFIAIASLIVGCAHFSKEKELPKEPRLSWIEAQERAARISDIHYLIDLNIGDKKEVFDGVTTLTFDLSDASKDLRIDLYEATLFEIKSNDQLIPLDYNKHFISIPQKFLQVGKNTVVIKYERAYAKNGKGLHRFIDPEDKRAYLHTQFETYYANRMFPSFDQPDLKATYTMNVTAPSDWEVITSVRESKKTKVEDGQTKWTFPESQKFSTYLISLHAGPYKKWERNGKIPLRLFARQSMAKYVRPSDWFSVTQAGFDFFNSYFGYPYPYIKYDQVLAPEFNSGAMENVAAVTFSERFLTRGQYSDDLLRNQANVILHEMAHMWFGNLVTMKWWDDLWLNESFATYMASLALSKIPRFKDSAWQDFLGTKSWGYWEDQMPTTHPILAKIEDTDQAGANFDGITYAKGAAVLKQLHFFLGDEGFQQGLKNYFKIYAEKNTQLKDFIQTLAEASETDLKFWTPEWLETAGLNSVEAKWNCTGNQLTSLELIQSASESHPTLRSHRLEVGFIYDGKNSSAVKKTKSALIKGASTKVDVNQIPCPNAVHPNFNDHAYIKVRLDEQSLKYLSENIHQLKDPVLRQMVWYTFWDRVKDSEESIFNYAELVISKGLPVEKNDVILNQLLSTVISRYGTGGMLDYLSQPALKDLPKTSQLIGRLQDVVFEGLKKAKPKSELQKSFFNTYVHVSRDDKNLNRLADILNGKIKFKGLDLDPDKRWALISQLSSYKFQDADKLIERELKKDSSYDGKLAATASQSALLDYDEKLKLITQFKGTNTKQSLHELWAEMGGLFPQAQEDLRIKYGSQFFEDFKTVLKEKNEPEKRVFYSLRPNLCSEPAIEQSQEFLEDHQLIMEASLEKRITKDQEEGRRCQKIINTALSSVSEKD